ncbi:MAG TPA: hypothetical protein VNL70_06815 [Tepidisphaeraceae bacterium]|nr:hypothetical protein [Tepidisphaeraceae bacterium]
MQARLISSRLLSTRIVGICSTVAELGLFFAAAFALAAGLISLR